MGCGASSDRHLAQQQQQQRRISEDSTASVGDVNVITPRAATKKRQFVVVYTRGELAQSSSAENSPLPRMATQREAEDCNLGGRFDSISVVQSEAGDSGSSRNLAASPPGGSPNGKERHRSTQQQQVRSCTPDLPPPCDPFGCTSRPMGSNSFSASCGAVNRRLRHLSPNRQTTLAPPPSFPHHSQFPSLSDIRSVRSEGTVEDSPLAPEKRRGLGDFCDTNCTSPNTFSDASMCSSLIARHPAEEASPSPPSNLGATKTPWHSVHTMRSGDRSSNTSSILPTHCDQQAQQ